MKRPGSENETRVRGGDDESVWTGRLAIGAGLLFVLIAVGVAISVMTWRDGRTTKPGHQAAVTASARSAYTSLCGVSARDFDKPTADFPAHARVLGSGARIAEMGGVGPCRLSGDIPRGYVFSPKGATLAALNYVSLLSRGGGRLAEVMAALQVPGPGTDVMVADARRRPPAVERQATVKGFKVVTTASAGEVRVVVAVEFPSNPGSLVAWSVTVRWRDHDWKVEPMDTETGWEMSPVKNLTREGFTSWGF